MFINYKRVIPLLIRYHNVTIAISRVVALNKICCSSQFLISYLIVASVGLKICGALRYLHRNFCNKIFKI